MDGRCTTSQQAHALDGMGLAAPQDGLRAEVAARAPIRIDLAGGWCDCPLYTQAQDDAATVNLAIEPGCACVAGRRSDGGCATRIETPPGVGPGSGLGMSAALAVAHVAAVRRWPTHEQDGRGDLAEAAFHYERALVAQITGRQDHYAAAMGGFRLYEWGAADDTCSPRITDLDPDGSAAWWLWDRCSVFHTGRARSSGGLHDTVWARPLSELAPILKRIADGARHAAEAVRARDLPVLAHVVDEQRSLAAELHDSADVPELDRLIGVQSTKGTLGAKPLGAGGGGCVLVVHEPDTKPSLTAAARAMGWLRIEWKPSRAGVTVDVPLGADRPDADGT